MSQNWFVAEASERPLIKIDRSHFIKSKDEKLMVKVHKANIKADSIKSHGTTKWKPTNRLKFAF